MSLQKSDIPILEYDNSQKAIIMPDRKGVYTFPPKAVFPFLADEVETFAKENRCGKIGEFISATKIYPIYKTRYQSEEVCFCQAPVGAAAGPGGRPPRPAPRPPDQKGLKEKIKNFCPS